MLVLSVASADTKSSVDTWKVVLLPIEQANIGACSKLSDKQLSNAMHIQSTKLKDFELIEFAELSKAFNKQLVDDAVFELLVTDDLKHTLAKLDAMETKTTKLAEYCKTAKEVGIDYLVNVSILWDLTQLRITYTVYDTNTCRVTNSKSFYDVPNDPIGISDEITKRIVRSLWQLRNKK